MSSAMVVDTFRPPHHRIFVNKTVDFSRIRAVGFDMDFTLAVYNKAYEALCYDLTIDNLVTKFSYPECIRSLTYDPDFAIRGVFLDKATGNILKLDEFGFIQVCVHGRTTLSKDTYRKMYPDGCVRLDNIEDSARYFLLSTFFASPQICLYSDLVVMFENMQTMRDPTASCIHEEALKHYELQGGSFALDCAIGSHDLPPGLLSYHNLFDDVNKALAMIHPAKAALKQTTQAHPEKYLIKSKHLPLMLLGLRAAGKKVFLLTNSEFEYTDAILCYLLGENYRDFFDYFIVSASKPDFFTKNTQFRLVDKSTGNPLVGCIGNKFLPGAIYAGGNITRFTTLTKISPKHVLYVGDHIIGDISIPRNEFWRTCLIIPEIEREVKLMNHNFELYNKLSELEIVRRGLLIEKTLADVEVPPELHKVQTRINAITLEIDRKYNPYFGSSFTTTWAMTWLSSHIAFNCDLYTCFSANILYYPSYYMFSLHSGNRFMPHQFLSFKYEVDPDGNEHRVLAMPLALNHGVSQQVVQKVLDETADVDNNVAIEEISYGDLTMDSARSKGSGRHEKDIAYLLGRLAQTTETEPESEPVQLALKQD